MMRSSIVMSLLFLLAAQSLAAEPQKVAEMQKLMDKLITEGRSTPGVAQKNRSEERRVGKEC
jgi:hypothetical protein